MDNLLTIKPHTLFRFSQLLSNLTFFWFQYPIPNGRLVTMLHHNQLTYFLRLLLAMIISLTYCVFDDLENVEEWSESL